MPLEYRDKRKFIQYINSFENMEGSKMLDEVTENKFHHWGNQKYSDIHAKKKLIKRPFFRFFQGFFHVFPDFSG